MNTALLEEVLACPRLPSLPAIAAQVIELTSDPDVSMHELASLIQKDQALAAKILRTVNSSFYGLRKRCSTIEKALVLLGLTPVKSLVLGFSLVSVLPRESEYYFDYLSYWRRSLYSAVAARELALQLNEFDPEEAFLASLFQDVGMMALHMAIPKNYAPLLEKAGSCHSDLLKAELSVLEISHADLGGMLCERWKLPEQIIHPVRFHERSSAAPVAFVDLSRAIAFGVVLHDVLTEANPVDALRSAYRKGKEWFRLEPNMVDEIVLRTTVKAKEMSTLLELDTGPAANAEQLLHDAQDHLVTLHRESPEGSSVLSSVESSPYLDAAVDDLDPLTGLISAYGLKSSLFKCFEISAKSSEPMGIAHIEVGGIEEILQTGRLELADEAIVLISMHLKRTFEPMGGFIGRSNVGAFMAIVPGLTRVAMVRAAEAALIEMRTALRDMQAVNDWPKIPVELSIGIAAWETSASEVLSSPQRVLAASVRASRAAKDAGGNCLRTFVPKVAA